MLTVTSKALCNNIHVFPTHSTCQTWQSPLGNECSGSKQASSVVAALQETLCVSLCQHANHAARLLASSHAAHLFLQVHTSWQAQTAFSYAQTPSGGTLKKIRSRAVKPVCTVLSRYVQF